MSSVTIFNVGVATYWFASRRNSKIAHAQELAIRELETALDQPINETSQKNIIEKINSVLSNFVFDYNASIFNTNTQSLSYSNDEQIRQIFLLLQQLKEGSSQQTNDNPDGIDLPLFQPFPNEDQVETTSPLFTLSSAQMAATYFVPSPPQLVEVGTVSFAGSGSTFNYNIRILPPKGYSDFTSTQSGAGLLTDLCHYAKNAPSTVEAEFAIEGIEDVFGNCSDAALLVALDKAKGGTISVNVSCDGSDHLHLNDLYQKFSMGFTPTASDRIFFDYSDKKCHVTHTFDFLNNYSQTNLPFHIDIKPCVLPNCSDCKDIPVYIKDLVDNPLLTVETKAHIEEVAAVYVRPLPYVTSDPEQLCKWIDCAETAEKCLETLAGGDIKDLVVEKARVTYHGPLIANAVIDLENCRIFFDNIRVC